jgi:MFS family permease
MKVHPLINSFLSFKGNARGCIYTEALNGVPANLVAPFASVYMLALGVNDAQIGLILSIGWACQLILAIFSGVITDKLGRRLTTMIFDIFAWSIPAVILAFATSFWQFMIAAMLSAFLRITQNAWTCLMVEDADPDQLIDLFTWVQITCLISGYFVPLAGLMINAYGLVQAMRVIYFIAAFLYTLKAIITYIMTVETQQGLVRMQATRGTSLFESLKDYRGLIPMVLKTPATLYTAGIMLVVSIANMINGSFWSVIATEKIGIPAEHIAMFPFVKSMIMLIFFFVVVPRLKDISFKVPLAAAFAAFLLAQVVLVFVPQHSYVLLMLNIILEACALATINPLLDSMMIRTIHAAERARIQSLLYVGIILGTSPFGWIAGQLSTIDRALPFVLNMLLFVVGGVLAMLAGKLAEKREKMAG